MRNRIVATALAVSVSGSAHAAPILVRDIQPGTEDSSPRCFAEAGGRVFFQAKSATSGVELWSSDGTPTGTQLVKDIVAGTSDSNPSRITAVGGKVVFRTELGTLWSSDGTPGGTSQLSAAIVAGPATGRLTVAGSRAFVAGIDSKGSELWMTDGTAGGTAMVKDVQVGDTGSNPTEIVAIGNNVYFASNDGTHGIELWKSDGTPGGTVMVKDIEVGGGDSGPKDLVDVGGALFFQAYSPATGLELWKSDGTESGTVLVSDINPGPGSSSPSQLRAAGGTLLFEATDGEGGRALWRSDGTAGGTRLLQRTGSVGELTPINGFMLFTAHPTSGWQLWRSDGTTSGTRMVRGFTRTSPSGQGLSAARGHLYFFADEGSIGAEPWRSDGTPGGTQELGDLQPGPVGSFDAVSSPLAEPAFQAAGTRVFFAARTQTDGLELWSDDLPDGGGVGPLPDGGVEPPNGGRNNPPNPLGPDAMNPNGSGGGTASSCACSFPGAAAPASSPYGALGAFSLVAGAVACASHRRRRSKRPDGLPEYER